MRVLVIAEHDGQYLKSATLNTVTAALELSSDVDVLILGDNPQGAPEKAATIKGITKVICIKGSGLIHGMPEIATDAVLTIAHNYGAILAPATTFGKNLLPRIAMKLDVMQISDVIKIISGDTFERPIYAGNALLTVRSLDAIKVMTIRPTNFSACSLTDIGAPIENMIFDGADTQSTFIGMDASVSERPELSSARIVISGGRGLGSKENFQLIEKLADCLNAAIGASRAAVDAGYVPNDYQVGQTGKVVAPELYIAVGISGAIQHLAGMKDSKVIIAINKDPDAPIFQIADVGLVGDLFEIVPQLTKELCG